MGMNLKGWLFRFLVADSLIKKAYGMLDDYLTTRWPQRWPQIQFAMRGWVTVLGVVITAVSGAALWAIDQMNNGGHPEWAVKLGVQAGLLIVGLGIFRKALKWLIYEEAIDKDGWLDDPKAKKPEGFGTMEKALLAGRIKDVKVDLEQAQAGLEETEAVLKEKTRD